MIRLIKRYGSRKLYDTEDSRYVSLEEIADWIRKGQEVRVVDTRTSEDVTSSTLTQIILEEGRRGTSFVTSDFLHQLIRRGGEVVSSGVEQFQQGVDRALQASIDRIPPLRRIREETAQLRERLDALEASLTAIEHERIEEAPGEPAAPLPAGNTTRTSRRKGVHS